MMDEITMIYRDDGVVDVQQNNLQLIESDNISKRLQSKISGCVEISHDLCCCNSNQNAKNDGNDLSGNDHTDPSGEQLLHSNQPRNRENKPDREMAEYVEFEKNDSGSRAGNHENTQNLQPLTWRGKMKNLLHSKPFHIAVIVLVLVDTVLVVTEILLDLKVIELHEESSAPDIVHYCSITILSIFMIEIGMKLVADSHHFWTHKMEIFDAIVVIVAFACDVAIAVLEEENPALVAVGFLVMLRLWRIVRIVNGIILTVKNEADDRVHAIKHELKEKEEELEKLHEQVEKQEKETENLKRILSENGIHFENEEAELGDGDKGEVVLKLEESENVISIDT